MSRRSGLGRGLAALIPPANERRDRDEEAGDPGATSPTSSTGASTTAEPPATPVAADPPHGSEPGDAGDGEQQPGAGGGVQEDAHAEVAAPRADPAPSEGASAVAAATATYAEVPPARIRPNPRQPRDVFDPEELEGLATSLADIGVLQPLVVRPLSGGDYELIAGERRLRAASLAGLEVVPVLIRHTDDADLLKEALVENIHRVQLNALEEAAAYEQLLEEFGVTQEELAARLGKSRPAISNALRLLRLPLAVQRRVAAGVLSAGHAKALLTLDDPDAQSKLAARIVAEGLSVRATEELVRHTVLDDTTSSSRRSRSRVTAPGLVELQDDLSDALEARVRITMGARKGKLAIEFSSVDDLERIVAVIADGLGHRRTSTTE